MAKRPRDRSKPKVRPRPKAKSHARAAMKSKAVARRKVEIKQSRTTARGKAKTSASRERPARRTVSVLVTGFGPFPGAPFNPSAILAERLARGRRPAFTGVRLQSHVFPTSYTAVDRDLPKLIAKFRPDAILMFGLGARVRHLRIETRARNALSYFADATGFSQSRRVIAAKDVPHLEARLPVQRLVYAARLRRVMAKPSHDAGHYVCNYLLWRALEAAARPRGPRLAVFVHVPRLRRAGVPHSRLRRRRMSFADLHRGGEAILLAIVAAARR